MGAINQPGAVLLIFQVLHTYAYFPLFFMSLFVAARESIEERKIRDKDKRIKVKVKMRIEIENNIVRIKNRNKN